MALCVESRTKDFYFMIMAEFIAIRNVLKKTYHMQNTVYKIIEISNSLSKANYKPQTHSHIH